MRLTPITVERDSCGKITLDKARLKVIQKVLWRITLLNALRQSPMYVHSERKDNCYK